MSLDELKQEKVLLEKTELFAEFKQHRFDENRSEQVKLFQTEYTVLTTKIFEHENFLAAGVVAMNAQSQTLRYEETAEKTHSSHIGRFTFTWLRVHRCQGSTQQVLVWPGKEAPRRCFDYARNDRVDPD